MNLRYRYEVSSIRKAYRKYIEQKHPNWGVKSVVTRVDDSFCLFRWLPESEAWRYIFETDFSLEKSKEDFIEAFLMHRKNPSKDAGGYIRAIREFQGFLEVVSLIEKARIREPRKILSSD